MSEPFLAEVRMVGFTFAPKGWAFCDGQILPINQNQSLYSLLGTLYGGDGRTTFALPDLRGRVPIHVGRSNGGANHPLGSKDGEETYALSAGEMPQHTHLPQASASPVDAATPTGLLLGQNLGLPYANLANQTPTNSAMIANVGGGQAHENMQPYLALNFCIALQGIFPSRN